MILVTDASVAVKWLVAEEGHEYAAQLLQASPNLRAPDLIGSEVANVLWKKVRRQEMKVEQGALALTSLPRFFEALVGSSAFLARAFQLAVELDHPVYDCVYLACAESEGAKLATADARLARKLAHTEHASRILLVDRVIAPEELA